MSFLCLTYSAGSMMSTYLTKVQNYRTRISILDGLQSIPQWQSALDFPGDGKVRGLIFNLF